MSSSKDPVKFFLIKFIATIASGGDMMRLAPYAKVLSSRLDIDGVGKGFARLIGLLVQPHCEYDGVAVAKRIFSAVEKAASDLADELGAESYEAYGDMIKKLYGLGPSTTGTKAKEE